ncbi:MAG: immune inhibitor A [Planctomycetes bacterium]|nr:immune inhibitor A [Planctomycetota bacterium]
MSSNVRRSLVPPLVVVLSSVVSAQTVLFSDGFENGLGNWIPSGLWNPEAATDTCGAVRAPFPEGTHAAYYGIDGVCNYDTPPTANSGALTLATPIAIPATTPTARLEFHQTLRVEQDTCWGPYDYSQIDVSTDGGATWTHVAANCVGDHTLAPVAWHQRAIDLTAYRGQSILLRFLFETMDEQLNDLFGWMIDDVEVLADPGIRGCAVFCPCNTMPPGWPHFGGLPLGCGHSFGSFSLLEGNGSPTLANDTLVLHVSALPPNAGSILLESLDGTSVTPFGDGFLCLTGALRRVAAHTASGGASTWPGPSDPPLSTALQSAVPAAGLTVSYQVYFRDVASFCTPATFNTTNSYRVVWMP